MTRRTSIAVVVFCLVLVAGPGDVGAAPAHRVDLPSDGASFNRTHIQFRWDTFDDLIGSAAAAGSYELQIVEDDGSADPFAGGASILGYPVSGGEPRTVVTSGLEFDETYAWRVKFAPIFSTDPAISPIRRFSTEPISDWVPAMALVFSAGAEAVAPGLTCWNVRRSGYNPGQILCVDVTGELVLQYRDEQSMVGDMRLMDNGRLFYAGRLSGSGCRWATVKTIGGKEIWASPHANCEPDGFGVSGVHHEVFPMPANAPRGANFLILEHDNRFVTFFDEHDSITYVNYLFRGDQVNEYDRHTKEIVRHWSAMDPGSGVCIDDHLPPEHPRGAHPPNPDIFHSNAAVYDVERDRVAVSLRQQSRFAVIDWSPEQPATLFTFGERYSSPTEDAVPFPCAPAFGDDLFSFEHAPEILPDGNWLIYDNGPFHYPQLDPQQSRVIEIEFDDPDNPSSAEIVWEFRHVAPDLVSPTIGDFVGDADRQPNGNTLTHDGRNSYVMEVDPSGNVVWYMTAGLGWPGPNDGNPATAGTLIYRVEKVPSLIIDTPGDVDGDSDLDMVDLAGLQASYPERQGAALGFPERLSDHDGDGVIDQDDVDAFAYWMTGPAR